MTVFDGASLRGRVAVVTGASRGIGLSICEHLRAMGAQVVQLDVLFPEESEVPVEANGMLAMRCDVADPASVALMASTVRTAFGRCDVLVNNAGITASPAALEDFPIDEWDRVFRVNLRGALLCAQALVPMMFEAQAGSIVNVASISARSPTRAVAYGATKAGLRALTQQMAVEWGPRRIGRPEDIGGIVAFLASDASGYINGEDIVADGGFLKAALNNLYNNPAQ
ncbi:NAD(P)-dependent dehydrogenase (short-subunit alcohol dehydrogenase family) [Variovorax sp. 1140]|uniref:SDR family NAD(P)-dependent oxidoreductase n=1 Tax=Variovorax atrisoli TaxID=3394203 RepID=UPI003392F766